MISDVRVFENVLAFPRPVWFNPEQFLFDSNGNQIDDIDCYFYCVNKDKKQPVGKCPNIKPKTIIEEGVFGGWILSDFSHFMMDATARLWYQKHNTCKTYFFDVCADPEFDWYERINKYTITNQFGEIFGFNPFSFEMIREPTLFKKLIIPNSLLDKGLVPKNNWQSFVKDCKWKPTTNEKYEKIYIPRINVRDNMTSYLFGESAFVEYLKNEGFYIFDVMNHSISNQREIINNAGYVVMPEGSGVLWSMYCDTKPTFVILSRRPARMCKNKSDIVDLDFQNIVLNYTKSYLLDHVVCHVDGFDYGEYTCPTNKWSDKSIILNWEKISLELKNLGLVKSLFKENGGSRKDINKYKELYPLSLDKEYYVEKCLRQIGDKTHARPINR